MASRTVLDMSREMKANESPNHFMVLDAIGRGMKVADKISVVARLDKTEVELILNDSCRPALDESNRKKGFLKSKLEFTITETGLDLLNSKKRELEQKTQDIKQAYGSGNTAQFQSFMGTDRAWIPFLLFSGLLDVLFFASAMSFLGMAMSLRKVQLPAILEGMVKEQLILHLIQIQQQTKKTLALMTQIVAEAETSKGEDLTAPEILEQISTVILTFSKLLLY